MRALCAAAVLVALACPAGAAELTIDPKDRPLKLEVYKSGLMAGRKHQFEFPSYRGTVQFDPEAPERTRVELEIDAREFRLMDTWVSQKDHKKIVEFTHSDEMLDTARYPKMTFTSTSAEASGEGYRVTGTLTIKGVAKPVTLELQAHPEEPALQVEGSAKFPMSPFGLKPPTAVFGTIRTKDEMLLEFSVVARPSL